jgi:glycosyltransferase involved in cell wall biosynthesis
VREASPELSVVVLCYRAEEDAPDVVLRLLASLEADGSEFEVVLVANAWAGSDDSTPEVAAALAKRSPRIRVVSLDKQGGMGWDMLSGLAAARGRYVVVIDGDGQVPVEYAVDVFRMLAGGAAEIVKGRRHGRQDGVVRTVLSFAYNTLFRLVFGTRGLWDVNGRPKGFTRSALDRLDLAATDWFIDAEIVLKARRLGIDVAEIPTDFLALSTRPSFVGPATVWEFLVNMVRWRTGRHPADAAGPLEAVPVGDRG